jgi:hypothetical protein
MKRRILTMAKWITASGAGIVIACWVVSYDAQLDVAWTQRTSLHQVTLCRGSVHVIRNDDWWRKEKLNLQLSTTPAMTPVHTWPGVRIERRHALCGFERTKGKWVSPYIHVTADTEFTSQEKWIKPKTFISTTTPVSIYSIPCWSLATAFTLLAFACETCRRVCFPATI